MADDLAIPEPLIVGHGVAALGEAADTVDPVVVGGQFLRETAGIRVALEAGTDDPGPLGLRRRWAVANAVAPVLAAAFANSPLRNGRPTGWRSTRQALRRDTAMMPPASDPRAAWVAYALDRPVHGGAGSPSLRRSLRSGSVTAADLREHLRRLRPPVAARGHLEINVADRQPGDGWRVPLAVVTALMDDPHSAEATLEATEALVSSPGWWARAARDGLTDPVLAGAARACFLSAYAALARQGAARPTRDAVADFIERYVLRGRCPADDVLDHAAA